MKNDVGKFLSWKGTYRSKQLPLYIPVIPWSDILSKRGRHFINEHILQPHVDKSPPTMTFVRQRRRTKSVTKSLQ